jgi:hypothetical protein
MVNKHHPLEGTTSYLCANVHHINFSSSCRAPGYEMTRENQLCLDVQEPNFLTGSQSLAEVARRDQSNHPGYWTIRPNLMEFLHYILRDSGQRCKRLQGKKESNNIAHKLLTGLQLTIFTSL